jgi:class 3 adenylate cyclase/pimeloyl-ACP methyl ester carboxylesterase
MTGMEPQFRFCTSADGTRIAYATYGSGPALLYANTPILSFDAQLRVPEARVYFEALASRTGLVIFDRRGTGASQRDVDDLSPESEALDIAAVADAAGLRDFTLFADIATHVCLTYVLGKEQRSRRLILWSPLIETNPSKEMAEAALRDWSYFRRLWASSLYPDGPVSLQRAMGKAYKDTATPEMAARRLVWRTPDFDALLPRVTIPVLMIHRERMPHQQAMRLASHLSHGQLRFVPGHPATPYPDHEAIVDAVFEFMGVNEPDAGLPPGMAVILFTDIVDSTLLTERMGDAAFRALSSGVDARVRAAVREHSGTPVAGKVLGDGVMGVFSSASQAIAAARACTEASTDAKLPLHIGLHAGDVISEGTNVYGGAVNIASRICGLCEPGEILVSQTVRDLARTSAGVTFEDRGEQLLKGIADPVRVFAVRPGE